MAGLAPKPVPPQHTVLPPSRQVEDCGRRSTGPGLLNAWLGTPRRSRLAGSLGQVAECTLPASVLRSYL